jgi:hypothetical protein
MRGFKSHSRYHLKSLARRLGFDNSHGMAISRKRKPHNHPAFPVPAFPGDQNTPPIRPNSGMGIRDWFAGMAMQALLSKDSSRMEYEILADVAYDIADSMMEHKENE